MAPSFLKNCVVAISGTFPGYTQGGIGKLVNENGGEYVTKVTDTCTHLIVSEKDAISKSAEKVKQAEAQPSTSLVNLQWLLDSIDKKRKLAVKQFLISDGSTATPAPAATKKRGRSAKVKDEPSEEDDDEKPPAKQARKTTKVKDEPSEENDDEKPPARQTRKTTKVKDEPEDEEDDKVVVTATDGDANGATKIELELKKERENGQKVSSKTLMIPVDECFNEPGQWSVYIDSDGMIWDASLNQTNAGNNNNKFYRIQLLSSSSGYVTWTRWGRVGDRGQSAALYGGGVEGCKKIFNDKFKAKSGLSWNDRLQQPKKGKYTFIERNYEPDSDDDDDDDVKDENAPDAPSDSSKAVVVESKLDSGVQDLIKLIFNQTFFQSAMADMSYDAKKLPLGKLSKRTINQGLTALKDLSELLRNPALAQEKHGSTYNDAIEDLSNMYYTVIPHVFGRNRPPVIRDDNMLKKEVDLLDSLSEMSIASAIMKDADKDAIGETLHPLDRQYAGLGMNEMTTLDQTSNEFKHLEAYLLKTHGVTHSISFKVLDIYRIERQGENDRFAKSKYAEIQGGDRRLLWHGSRATNFGGILSQGLRIAPPEAPVNGYMFGKGVYLADMSSKSAGYTSHHSSGGTGLLLLCEAELGAPMYELTGSSYSASEDAISNGCVATWGKGRMAPPKWKDAGFVNESLKGVKMPDVSAEPAETKVPGAGLWYNEFICYDVAQIRLRYLFRVKMN